MRDEERAGGGDLGEMGVGTVFFGWFVFVFSCFGDIM